ADYSHALNLIDDYDHARLPEPSLSGVAAQPLTLSEARQWIDAMRGRFGSDLFGREKDQGLESALSGVFQTIGGRDAYPAIEEKAANLLYFLVKNHPFVDGNKRIGAALFLGFLEKNGALHRPDGSPRLSEEALVAVTLLVAESPPKDKEILTRLIVALLAGEAAVEGGRP
ncbi:MAG: Fic family protein, partial [Mariprofundaceae bacterium]|nr:Fic family protein [Mariprofundaceae bacterium]